MRRRVLVLLSAALLLAPCAAARAQRPGGEPLTVFAAASLTDAFEALGEQWKSRTGQDVRFSFAASSALARQVEQGAPADLFASADEQWMDYLAKRGLIADATRTDPIGNALVLVAPRGAARPVQITRDTSIPALLGPDGRLATGDPDHVPAGIYAKQALTWMGQWDAVAPRLARADNVRSALLLVERGEAPLGIVYATDAAIDPGVRVIGTFPAESHPPVAYPFALTRRAADDPRARALLAFLAGPDAEPTYRRFGFATGQH